MSDLGKRAEVRASRRVRKEKQGLVMRKRHSVRDRERERQGTEGHTGGADGESGGDSVPWGRVRILSAFWGNLPCLQAPLPAVAQVLSFSRPDPTWAPAGRRALEWGQASRAGAGGRPGRGREENEAGAWVTGRGGGRLGVRGTRDPGPGGTSGLAGCGPSQLSEARPPPPPPPAGAS